MSKLVNLTPHPIVLCSADGAPVITIPPSGNVARCSTQREMVDRFEVDGVTATVNANTLGNLEGLPDPAPDTYYVVSMIAATAAAKSGRTHDVLVPDEAVRDPQGRVIGCRGFARQ